MSKEPRSSEELRLIARDCLTGVKWLGYDETTMEPFRGIILLAAGDEKVTERLSSAAFLYADMKDASPTGINGMPFFLSMGIITKDEADVFLSHYTEIQTLLYPEQNLENQSHTNLDTKLDL